MTRASKYPQDSYTFPDQFLDGLNRGFSKLSNDKLGLGFLVGAFYQEISICSGEFSRGEHGRHYSSTIFFLNAVFRLFLSSLSPKNRRYLETELWKGVLNLEIERKIVEISSKRNRKLTKYSTL